MMISVIALLPNPLAMIVSLASDPGLSLGFRKSTQVLALAAFSTDEAELQ